MGNENHEHEEGMRLTSATPMKLENVEFVAPMLGLTTQALYAAVREGIVPAVRIGRRIRFNLDVLAQWSAQGGKAVGASEQL